MRVIYKITILALVVITGFYATFIEPTWINIQAYDIRSDTTLDSIRIIQLSDLHLQNIGKREIKIAEQVNSIQADLIILTGDVIDKADKLLILHTFLNDLHDLTAVAVLGNWEHWSGVDISALREEYQHHNVRLLVNEIDAYQIKKRTIQVLGLDDSTAGQPNYDLLQYPIEDDLSILALHSPVFFDNLPTITKTQLFDLCLAGHTHGGQVTLFGQPIWMPPGSGTFASGLYQTPVCNLYVSKGIGTSILPIRFWARPEIAVFDL